MKAITQFKADDGTIFDNSEAASQYESMCENVSEALAPLGPEIANHKGWVQHSPEAVANCWEQFVAIAWPKVKSAFKNDRPDAKDIHPMSYFGRVLDDSDTRCLKNANYRFCCTDKEGREHEQPFYAINGPVAGQVCLQDRR